MAVQIHRLSGPQGGFHAIPENGDRVADIADGLGVTTATVYRELKRGETGGLDRNLRKAYNPVLAQQRVQENFKRRGKSAVNS